MKRGLLRKEIQIVERELGHIERKIWRFVFRFHYRKVLIFVILAVLAYLIFRNPDVQGFVSSLEGLEYLGVFIAGMLFTFGFTTPFAVGFFVILNPSNPILIAIIGGVGAIIGDLLIFSLIRFSFMDEFERLEKTRIMRKIRDEIKIHFNKRLRLYLLYAFAGLVIASPLPDEVGVTMLAGLTHIKISKMMIISFVFNSFGIFLMCLV